MCGQECLWKNVTVTREKERKGDGARHADDVTGSSEDEMRRDTEGEG